MNINNRKLDEEKKVEKLLKENEELKVTLHNLSKIVKYSLLKCNNNLRSEILKIYHNILLYENQEIDREKEFIVNILINYQRLNSQTVKENYYLRQLCEKVIGVSSQNKEINNKSNAKIQEKDEKLNKKPNLHRRTDTKVSLNINAIVEEKNKTNSTIENNKSINLIDNKEITIVEVKINIKFQGDKSNNSSLIMDSNQSSVVNTINTINTNSSIENAEGEIISENDLVDDENDDAFGFIDEYNKNAKTNKTKVKCDPKESQLKNSNQKQKFLFSTPKNKETKRIDFTGILSQSDDGK